MPRPSETSLFQERAARAHAIIGQTAGEIIQAWSDVDASNASDGQSIDLRLCFHPMLSGAMAAFVSLAWDSAPPGSSMDEVLKAFVDVLKDRLVEVAAERPAGVIVTKSQSHGG